MSQSSTYDYQLTKISNISYKHCTIVLLTHCGSERILRVPDQKVSVHWSLESRVSLPAAGKLILVRLYGCPIQVTKNLYEKVDPFT